MKLYLAHEHGGKHLARTDFGCILGELSMSAPDLAAVQLERWNKAVKNDGWLENSLELAIEVASPSNRTLQRKAALYLDHGAEQVWIVYRKTRPVVVVTPEGTTEARVGEALEFRGIQVLVAALFPNA